MMLSKPIVAALTAFGLTVSAASAQVTCTNENSAVTETTPAADFTDNGDGTVTDTRTGLVWMRCSLGQTWNAGTRTCDGTASTYTWQAALQSAIDVNSGASNDDGDGAAGYAGATDWRLPNRNELTSIVERRCWEPAINVALFPNTPSSWFWSSSPYAGSSGDAWYVHFYDGYVNAGSKSSTRQVRLVRAGQ